MRRPWHANARGAIFGDKRRRVMSAQYEAFIRFSAADAVKPVLVVHRDRLGGESPQHTVGEGNQLSQAANQMLC